MLSGVKYGLDYYQREYNWTTKQVEELLSDLSGRFLADFDPSHERSAVEGYGRYFLGSVILSDKDKGSAFIVDGQQRLTTLSLLLIYLSNLQGEREDAVALADLIFSEKYGRKSFNLEVPERTSIMDKLYSGEEVEPNGLAESVRNIVARYHDIEEQFPEDLREAALPFFVDWLIDNVDLVEITAFSDEDAYTIFETMNDRGLPLSPTDMLKGYLLANIQDDLDKTAAAKVWKEVTLPLRGDDKTEEADFFKAWFRSQHAATIRDRTRGASPKDWDRIGTEFHRWIRENHKGLGLTSSAAVKQFIERDLAFYARQYHRIKELSTTMVEGFERLYYLNQLGFTWQYTVLLAPLDPADDAATTDTKIQATAAYLDILLAQRLWTFRLIAYSTLEYAMFVLARDIRRKSVPELVDVLAAKLDAEEEKFASNERLYVHQQNRRFIHYLLARMTSYIEVQSGAPSHFVEYLTASGNAKFEVEHIWADKYERHTEEFAHENDFREYRNRIGDLLLLPKSFNAAYGALPYEDKLPHYFGQNILAQSLSPLAYERNPGFVAFKARTGLEFEPYDQFKKADLDRRGTLYLRLAKAVWSKDELLRFRSAEAAE